MGVGLGIISMPAAVVIGAPQPMHADALLLTARPHSLQTIKAKRYSPVKI
jgi:hypothetical protein